MSNVLPETIAGYQSVVVGPTMAGDIWVNRGTPMDYVNTAIDKDVEQSNARYPSWSIYRKLPQPGHHQPDVVAKLKEAGLKPAGSLADSAQQLYAHHMPSDNVFYTPHIETKPSNPKDLVGSDKIPLHLWPTTASVLGSLALLDGMLKYGRSNFRVVGVRATIYYDALNRHMKAWLEGEDLDPDSGLPHLAHALACIAVLVDAQAAGKLEDDRLVAGKYREFIEKMTPHVKRLKEKHKGKDPVHYTIKSKTTT